MGEAASEFSKLLWDVRQHFVDSISHDLMNPASAATAAAELILRRTRSPLCRKSAVRIAADMHRIGRMIESLLDVSRLRAGQSLPLKFEDFDLDLLIQEVIEDYTTAFHGRIKLYTNGRTEGHWSQEGLRRVTENLITNALKYGSPNSPIRITIEKLPECVRLIVHNDGNPIPLEKRAELFTPFRRLNPLEKKGWGLGLVLVKGIVDAHGGTVSVESSEETGTSFIVDLPHPSEESAVA
jgi:signal transduction histidine kinase